MAWSALVLINAKICQNTVWYFGPIQFKESIQSNKHHTTPSLKHDGIRNALKYSHAILQAKSHSTRLQGVEQERSTTCVPAIFYKEQATCEAEERYRWISCVASTMCASARNVNIPTPSQPTPLHRRPDVDRKRSQSSKKCFKQSGHVRSVLQPHDPHLFTVQLSVNHILWLKDKHLIHL